MQKKFWIPKTLYDELKKAAQEKGQTIEEYADDLVLALICGQFPKG